MKTIKMVKDSIGNEWFVVGDLLEYMGQSRGKASRWADKLPPKYVQTGSVPTNSGDQKMLLTHKLGAVFLMTLLTKDLTVVSELFKFFMDAQTDEIDYKLDTIPTSIRTKVGRTVSRIQLKIVIPAYGKREQAIIDRGMEPREITVAKGKKEVHIPNGRGGNSVFNGTLEQYLSRHEPPESHVKYPPELKPLTYTDDKGNLRERNTMRIIEHAKVDGSKPIKEGNTTVRQEEYTEEA